MYLPSLVFTKSILPGVRVAVLGRKKILKIFGTLWIFVFAYIWRDDNPKCRPCFLNLKKLPNILCLIVLDLELYYT